MQPTGAHQTVRIFYSYLYSCWGHSSEINENPMEWDKAAYVERGKVWLSNNNASWSTLSLPARCIPMLLEEGAVLSPTTRFQQPLLRCTNAATGKTLHCMFGKAEPREHLWVTWGLSQLPPELTGTACRWQWEHIASHHQDFLCTLSRVLGTGHLDVPNTALTLTWPWQQPEEEITVKMTPLAFGQLYLLGICQEAGRKQGVKSTQAAGMASIGIITTTFSFLGC